jgi:hypothetical protein
MKRLVLLGEGHGEVAALPVLARKLLQQKDAGGLLFVDDFVIRTTPSRLVKWDKVGSKPDYSEWISRVMLASRRREVGAVLAVYDGDAKTFPAGSTSPFCAGTAAKSMAAAAVSVGAGKMFSLSVVFACREYETWLVAGAESLKGRVFKDGRKGLPPGVRNPDGDPESHGKRWFEKNFPGYRPTRDQSALTELVDLQCVRAKNLRSFRRLDHALDQLLEAVAKGSHIATPGFSESGQEAVAHNLFGLLSVPVQTWAHMLTLEM